MNVIRAHLCAFGIVVTKGTHNVERVLEAARDVPDAVRPAFDMLASQVRDIHVRIEEITARISEMQAKDALARRLASVPGVGTISSSAFAAIPPDVAAFRGARDNAAWLGLTPQAHFSGGKERLRAHSQSLTSAARAEAERKTVRHLS